MPLYGVTHIWYNKKVTGSMPQFLQGQNWLYRKGNYGVQHNANQNPDNWWDHRFYCWTSDPECGLDVAPKRPMEDLVDPSILAKHKRDVFSRSRAERTGFHGF